MMRDYDVVVLGGGLAGASLALALHDGGRRVAVVDARPAGTSAASRQAPPGDPRAYAISPTAVEFLETIGVWRHLDRRRVGPVVAMDIRGDRGGRLRFSAFEAKREALAWLVEAEALEAELRETARRQSGIDWLAPAAPTALAQNPDDVALSLSTGARLSATLLVGADGRDSWLREAAGIVASTTGYGEQGIAACYACEHAHGDAARQWFLGDSVLAWLPLPDQRISIVWSAPDALAEHLTALDPDALALRVAAAGDHVLGRLSPLGPARGFPLRLIRVPDPIANRIALIGDAAHGIHPLSGHGINLGFSDARELAAAIADCPPGGDVGSDRVLRRYRRCRAEEVRLIQETTHGLRQLFAARAPGLSLLRNLGLSVTDRLPRVKSLLTRYAMG